MRKCKIIISLLVHEKPNELLDFIAHVKKFLKIPHRVLLHCNDFMFEELSQVNDDRFDINPDHFDKKRVHHSVIDGLLEAIISNIDFSINNYDFDYFLIMSPTDFFYQVLEDESDITKNKMLSVKGPPSASNPGLSKNYNLHSWMLKNCKNTKLYQLIKSNNFFYAASAAWGTVFLRESCVKIMNFFAENRDILDDLKSTNHCLEEFALQTICSGIFGDNFFNISNGAKRISLDECSQDKFLARKPFSPSLKDYYDNGGKGPGYS